MGCRVGYRGRRVGCRVGCRGRIVGCRGGCRGGDWDIGGVGLMWYTNLRLIYSTSVRNRLNTLYGRTHAIRMYMIVW